MGRLNTAFYTKKRNSFVLKLTFQTLLILITKNKRMSHNITKKTNEFYFCFNVFTECFYGFTKCFYGFNVSIKCFNVFTKCFKRFY